MPKLPLGVLPSGRFFALLCCCTLGKIACLAGSVTAGHLAAQREESWQETVASTCLWGFTLPEVVCKSEFCTHADQEPLQDVVTRKGVSCLGNPTLPDPVQTVVLDTLFNPSYSIVQHGMVMKPISNACSPYNQGYFPSRTSDSLMLQHFPVTLHQDPLLCSSSPSPTTTIWTIWCSPARFQAWWLPSFLLPCLVLQDLNRTRFVKSSGQIVFCSCDVDFDPLGRHGRKGSLTSEAECEACYSSAEVSRFRQGLIGARTRAKAFCGDGGNGGNGGIGACLERRA